MIVGEDETQRLVSARERCRHNGRMEDALDSLCADCLADVPTCLTSWGGLCVACLAIRMREPSLDRDHLLLVLDERARAEELGPAAA